MPKLAVEKKVHIQATGEKGVSVSSILYTDPAAVKLLESVAAGDRRIIRRSEDNGRTWRVVDDQPMTSRSSQSGQTTLRTAPEYFYDDRKNRLLALFVQSQRNPSVVEWEDNLALTTRRLYYQISSDGGETWSDALPIIQRGEGFDEKRWLPGVEYGMNSAYADLPSGLILDDGTMLFPCNAFRSFGPSCVRAPEGGWWLEVGCLRGTWKGDLDAIDWELGQVISIGRDKSDRGLDEPSIVALNGSRLLMVARAGKPRGGSFPGVKFYALSDDGGGSWSEPKVLTYEDGSYVYSPSSLVRLFRWHAAGGIYLVTNIFEDDRAWIGQNCDPRYPLQIAQIDEDSLCVKKATVTVIEDRQSDQPKTIRFSNFAILQDRQTRVVRLFMTASPGNAGWQKGDGVPRDAFEYVISFRK